VSLELHRPDGKGGLERKPVVERDHRALLRSPRWGAALPGRRLPRLGNPEMNPTSSAMAVLFWRGLGFATFVVLLVGYGTGFWH
jgi:hypothetical protein